MRFFTAIVEGIEKPGIAIGRRCGFLEDLIPDAPKNLLDYIDRIQNRLPEGLCEEDLPLELTDICLTAPILHPRHNVLCVGKNYLDHIAELGGGDEKPIPHYFTKRVNRMTGPDEELKAHIDLDPCVDYEVELAVIIGKTGINIPEDKVWDHILGFSILNDFSSRTLQRNHVQWFRGKSLDGYTALGPWIVTKDEFDQPLRLELTSKVNGEIRQQANTELMIFTIEQLVSELSMGMTLEAGDIIATGTPSGVGMGFDPPKYLHVGDTVTLSIDGIGTLENKIGSTRS